MSESMVTSNARIALDFARKSHKIAQAFRLDLSDKSRASYHLLQAENHLQAALDVLNEKEGKG